MKISIVGAALLSGGAAAGAACPHLHGVAKLDIVVEAAEVTVKPLNSFAAFLPHGDTLILRLKSALR